MDNKKSSSSALIALPSPIKEDEIEWKMSLPSGVKFRPSHKDLYHYLHMKVHTGRIDFGGVIRSINLYIYKPEDLRGLAFDNDDGRLYFFTPLQKKFTKGKKTNRVTGNGFWKVTQKSVKIMDDDNKPIMTKTPLCYFYFWGKKGRKTQWLMDQYKLINEGSNPVMLKNWVLCVVHYKPRGNNDTNKRSSTDSRSEAVGSSTQNSMIGSSSESNPQMSFGNNNFNVASSSNPQGTSSYPEPVAFQTPSNPNKRQQCSTSYDEPLCITCPGNDIASYAQFHKRRSPSANDTPNIDQNQASDPSFDQIVSNVLNQDPDEYTCLEPLLNLDIGDYEWKDDIFNDLFPSELNPQNSNPNSMNPTTTTTSHPTVSASDPPPPTFNSSADENARIASMAKVGQSNATTSLSIDQ
ncbi:NAC domain-containing protein 30-like [Rosa chinensis]|uniref:NAC domain-containing protein 30-like n=1 Tax=Rosa chinensis TaxID=74649 RepID=UPI000D08A26D|nr:NAC domain-containing protein 30-like [Rosa chinensis]